MSMEDNPQAETDRPDMRSDAGPQGERSASQPLVSEGIVLLFASAASYIGCYLFEQGYLRYFGAPDEFIIVSIQNLVVFAAAFAGIAIHFYVFAMTLSNFTALRVSRSIARRASLIYIAFLTFLIAGTIAIITGIGTWTIGTVSLFVTLLILFNRFRGPAADLVDFEDLIFKEIDNKPVARERGLFRYPAYANITLILALLWLAVVLCDSLGSMQARGRKTFAFLDNSPDVVLRRYSDHFVVGRINPDSGKLLPEFRLLPVEEVEGRLVIRRVGRLSRETPENQDPAKLWNTELLDTVSDSAQ